MQHNEMTKLYKGVIEEVIRNVRNDFVNMGVDEQVLYDLQMLWEQKLMDYKVISPVEYFGNGHGAASLSNSGIPNSILMNHPNAMMMGHHSVGINQQQAHQHHHQNIGTEGGLNILASGAVAAATSVQGPPNGQVHAGQAGYPYVQPSDNYGGFIRSNTRTTFYHPSQGYFEASSTIAPTAANLPNLNSGTSNVPSGANSAINPTPPAKQQQNPRRYDGAGDDEKDVQPTTTNSNAHNNANPDEIIQLLYTTDGGEEVILDKVKEVNVDNPVGSPADEDEINSDLDDDDDEDDKDPEAEGYDESGTLDENVVLCQYEKVSRTRNKWRCVFKSGIIHINGQDYVFSKANGEFEW